MCDPRDLGIAVTEATPTPLWSPISSSTTPTPAASAKACPLYRMAADLLARTAGLIRACPCESGCPICVGPAGEIGERGKEVALKLAACLL